MENDRDVLHRHWKSLLTAAAYFVAAASAVALTRFGGGAAFLWSANAVLLASLISSDIRRWPTTIAFCWVGGLLSSGLWGLGWAAAPAMTSINVGEPVIAALLVRRWDVQRSGLDSARHLSVFMLAAGLIAPALSGVAGAFVIHLTTTTGYAGNLLHWAIAHSLGAVTFTPVFGQVADGELGRWLRAATRRHRAEAAALLSLVAAVTATVFAQNWLPLLFLPILPVLVTTFRAGRVGAASAIVVVAATSIDLTLTGRGPVNLIHGDLGLRLQFLQFYLAMTVLTVLPVAADLTRRVRLFERLRDSEARFRLLTENSTDVILNLDVDGIVRYASPSIRALGGCDPDALIGQSCMQLVATNDRGRVRATHRLALDRPSETFTVEYRGVTSGDRPRWFETHTRAVLDDAGDIQGVVSVVRETSDRRRQEMDLRLAADTDDLTGIHNRRAFDRELARLTANPDATGCVAIFDLDHFKGVNDRFGHPAGDDVLRIFARRAARELRDGDLLARVGGEEFAILFASMPAVRAQAVCERVRAAVAAEPFDADGQPLWLTVSIGVAAFTTGDPPAAVMRRADEALYRSKGEGRNRLSLAA